MPSTDNILNLAKASLFAVATICGTQYTYFSFQTNAINIQTEQLKFEELQLQHAKNIAKSKK
jgi:hypothetical protein